MVSFSIDEYGNQCFKVTGVKEGRASRSIVTQTERGVQGFVKIYYKPLQFDNQFGRSAV